MYNLAKGILALVFLAVPYPAPRQGTVDRSFPGISDARIHESLVTTPGGGLKFIIENRYARPVTAYVLLERMPAPNATTPDTEAIHFIDELYPLQVHEPELIQFPEGLQTGEYVVVPDGLPNATHPAECSILALMFADGATIGDSKWTTAIIERRNARLMALRQAVTLLQATEKGDQSLTQMMSTMSRNVNTLKTHRESDARAAWQEYHAANGWAANPSYAELRPSAWAQYQGADDIWEGAKANLDRASQSGHSTQMIQTLIRVYSQSISQLEVSKPPLIGSN